MQKNQENRTANLQLMQNLNINLVLDVIRNNSPISQAEISRVTKLSPGTITNLIKILKKNKFVRETGFGQSSGGRRPILLSLNPEARYVMAATFFADEITVALLNLLGEIKKEVTVPTEVEKGETRVFENFARAADSLLDTLRLDRENILGLGASFEGIFDPGKGMLILSNRFGWRNVPVRDLLEKTVGLKTFTEGDGRAMALGEYHYGVGKSSANMVCIDMDSGIGSAAVFNGRVYHGASNMEGEIGHIQSVPNGPKCRCGKRGCLETVASGSALIARVRRALEKGERFKGLRMEEGFPEHLLARAIFQAAEEDEGILGMIEEIGCHLGLAVANVINYSDPELVVLTGYMIHESGALLSNMIEEVARKQLVAGESRKVRIEKGILGEHAALIGAATLVYQDFFPYL
ncbi:MAG: ROK family transcriptional regulator [Candidatus Latescibacteria bacterium]|nr:ROK family transcriptional regulator [Candidatus Latescibacterota bacterium]